MVNDRNWDLVDGDTIDLRDAGLSALSRLRLRGYDAHELNEPGGDRATAFLGRHLDRIEIVPGIAGTRRPDLPDRGLADGFTRDGTPIGEEMIRGGFATPTRSSSQAALGAERTQVMRGFGRGWMYESAEAAHNREMLEREREGLTFGNITEKMTGGPSRATGGHVGQGWQRGIQQMKGSGGALLHWGGEVFDSEWAQEVGLDIFEAGMAQAQLYAPEVGSYANVDGVGAAWTYVLETLGEQAPNLLTMVAGAGVTGIAARATAAAIGRGMVEKHGAERAKRMLMKYGENREGLAADAAKFTRRAAPAVTAAADKVGKAGALGGVFASSASMNMGQTQGEFIEAGVSNPGLVLAMGIPQGLLDAGGMALIFGPVFKALSKVPGITTASARGIVAKEAAKGFGKGAALEAAINPLQEAGTMLARSIEDPDFWMLGEDERAETFTRLIDASLKGGIMGGAMMGAPAGTVQGVRMARAQAALDALNKEEPPSGYGRWEDGKKVAEGRSAEIQAEIAKEAAQEAQQEQEQQQQIKDSFKDVADVAELRRIARAKFVAGETRSQVNKQLTNKQRAILKGKYAQLQERVAFGDLTGAAEHTNITQVLMELEGKRENALFRDRIEDLSPEDRAEVIRQLREGVLTDEKTGLGTMKAYHLDEKLPAQAFIDVDSLAWINDNMGHDVGDALLAEVGKALGAQKGVKSYHISGDEFVVQARTPEQAQAAIEAAKKVLETARLEGEGYVKTGIGISYGIDSELGKADMAMQKDKAAREARGERAARKEMPQGVTPPAKKPSGDLASQDRAAEQAEAARVEAETREESAAEETVAPKKAKKPRAKKPRAKKAPPEAVVAEPKEEAASAEPKRTLEQAAAAMETRARQSEERGELKSAADLRVRAALKRKEARDEAPMADAPPSPPKPRPREEEAKAEQLKGEETKGTAEQGSEKGGNLRFEAAKRALGPSVQPKAQWGTASRWVLQQSEQGRTPRQILNDLKKHEDRGAWDWLMRAAERENVVVHRKSNPKEVAKVQTIEAMIARGKEHIARDAAKAVKPESRTEMGGRREQSSEPTPMTRAETIESSLEGAVAQQGDWKGRLRDARKVEAEIKALRAEAGKLVREPMARREEVRAHLFRLREELGRTEKRDAEIGLAARRNKIKADIARTEKALKAIDEGTDPKIQALSAKLEDLNARIARLKAEGLRRGPTVKPSEGEAEVHTVVSENPTVARVLEAVFPEGSTVTNEKKKHSTWTFTHPADLQVGDGNVSFGQLIDGLVKAVEEGLRTAGEKGEQTALNLRFEHPRLKNKETGKPTQVWVNARELANLGRAMAGNSKDTIGPRSTFVALGSVIGYLRDQGFVAVEGRDQNLKPTKPHFDDVSGFPPGKSVVYRGKGGKKYSWFALSMTGLSRGEGRTEETLFDAVNELAELRSEVEDARVRVAEEKEGSLEHDAALAELEVAQELYDDASEASTRSEIEQILKELEDGDGAYSPQEVRAAWFKDGRLDREVLEQVMRDHFADRTTARTARVVHRDKERGEFETFETVYEDTSDMDGAVREDLQTEKEQNLGMLRSDGDGPPGQAVNNPKNPKEQANRAQALKDRPMVDAMLGALVEGRPAAAFTELGELGNWARGVLHEAGLRFHTVVLGRKGLEDLHAQLTAQRGDQHAGIVTTLERAEARLTEKVNARDKAKGEVDTLKEGSDGRRAAVALIADLNTQIRVLRTEVNALRPRVEAKLLLEDLNRARSQGSPAWVIYNQYSKQQHLRMPIIFIDETVLKTPSKQLRALAHEMGHAVMRAEVERSGRSATAKALYRAFFDLVPQAKGQPQAVKRQLFAEWFAEMFAEHQLGKIVDVQATLPKQVADKHAGVIAQFMEGLKRTLRKVWAGLRKQAGYGQERVYNETFSSFMTALAARSVQHKPAAAAQPSGRYLPNSRRFVPTRTDKAKKGKWDLSEAALEELSGALVGLEKLRPKLSRHNNLADIEKLRKTTAGKAVEATADSGGAVLKSVWRVMLETGAGALDAVGMPDVRAHFRKHAGEEMTAQPIPSVLRRKRGQQSAQIRNIAAGFGLKFVDPWWRPGYYDLSTPDAALVNEVMLDIAITGDEAAGLAKLPKKHHKAYADLRKMMDDLHDNAESEGGLKIPYRKGYLPLQFNATKVRGDEQAFLKEWRTTLQERADVIAEATGKKKRTLSMKEAQRAWDNIQGEDMMLDQFGLNSDPGMANYGPALAHARARKLTPEQWARLRPWLEDDFLSVAAIYAHRVTRRMEYQKRGGYRAEEYFVTRQQERTFEQAREEALALGDEKAWRQAVKAEHEIRSGLATKRKLKMAELEGLGLSRDLLMQPTVKWQIAMRKKVLNGDMTLGDYNHITTRVLPSLMGTLGQHMHPRYRRLATALNMYQAVRVLTMSWFASVMDAGILTWRVDDAKIMASSVLEALRAPKDMTRQERREMYELTGTMTSAWTDHYLNSGMAQQQFAMGKANLITEVFFRANFMHQWTEGLRLVGSIAAQKYMIKHADMAKAGNAESAALLSHIGVTPDQVLRVANRKDGTLDFNPNLKTSAKIATAIDTFVNEGVLRPDAAARPWWGSHPIGSIFFFLKSFMFLFQEVVLRSIWNTAKRKGQGSVPRSVLEGFKVAAPMVAATIPLTIIGYELRRQIGQLGEEDWFEQLDQKGPQGYAFEIARRSGYLGWLELPHDMAGDAQRDKFVLTSALGPAAEQFIDGVFGGGVFDSKWWAGSTPVFASIPFAREGIGSALAGR